MLIPAASIFEDATQDPATAFADHTRDSRFDTGDNPVVATRREMCGRIKRKLIVERDGQLLAADALQRCFFFLESLEDQAMTATPSRLTTVQRAIENLETQLSSNANSRAAMLEDRLKKLEQEIDAVRSGDLEVLSGTRAEEEIREVVKLTVNCVNESSANNATVAKLSTNCSTDTTHCWKQTKARCLTGSINNSSSRLNWS